MVEPIKHLDRRSREAAIHRSGYNLFGYQFALLCKLYLNANLVENPKLFLKDSLLMVMYSSTA